MYQEQYAGMTDIFKKTLYLLRLLARENDAVQHHIFERLDILLEVRVVESDLAMALREVGVRLHLDNTIHSLSLCLSL